MTDPSRPAYQVVKAERDRLRARLDSVREWAKKEIEAQCLEAESATDNETREYHYGRAQALEEMLRVLNEEPPE